MTNKKLVQTAINTIRTLSMDAVQQANSGHPGTPMSKKFGFEPEQVAAAARELLDRR